MGWLIAEDLVMVLLLVTLPVIAKPGVAGVGVGAAALAVAVGELHTDAFRTANEPAATWKCPARHRVVKAPAPRIA